MATSLENWHTGLIALAFDSFTCRVINNTVPDMAGWSDSFGWGNSGMTIYPTTTYTPTELKKRITVRKFDEDGRVTEEIVTEEYGDKEIVQIPIYPTNPNPSPWFDPYQPNRITC